MLSAHLTALEILQDLRATVPGSQPICAKLRHCLDAMSEEIATLRYGNSLVAASEALLQWNDIGLTPTEGGYLMALKKAGPRGMEKSGLLSVMYASEPDVSWPEIKIIDVWASKIRKKFYLAGMTNPIRTVWGRGYRFEEPVKSPDFAETYAHCRDSDGFTEQPAARRRKRNAQLVRHLHKSASRAAA